MKTFASAWLPFAVALAIVLWLLATWVDIRMRPPEPLPAEESAPVADDLPREAPPASEVRPPGSCEVFEERLRQMIDGARACNVDDDCTLFDYGYPLDCMTSIAKQRIPALRDEYREYDEACEFRVFYDCPTDPYVRLALCRNNRCIVELDRRDELQDSTLEQMNRQRPRRADP